jgi:hypothetical protein
MQRTLADIVLVIHLIWRPAFWDRWLFRTIHLAGIVFVASLELLHKYCPLTIWENALRQPGQSGSEAPNYFIMGYIERLVYPDVSPLVYLLPTYGIALFTLVMFLVKRPAKFRCRSGGLPS